MAHIHGARSCTMNATQWNMCQVNFNLRRHTFFFFFPLGQSCHLFLLACFYIIRHISLQFSPIGDTAWNHMLLTHCVFQDTQSATIGILNNTFHRLAFVLAHLDTTTEVQGTSPYYVHERQRELCKTATHSTLLQIDSNYCSKVTVTLWLVVVVVVQTHSWYWNRKVIICRRYRVICKNGSWKAKHDSQGCTVVSCLVIFR